MQLTTSNSINNWKKEQKHKKQEENIKTWMSEKALPKEMISKIFDHIHDKFKVDEDVCVENLILDLPSELQGKVKFHICFELLKKVSFFNSINLLNNCLSPCIMTKFIQKENDNSIKGKLYYWSLTFT